MNTYDSGVNHLSQSLILFTLEPIPEDFSLIGVEILINFKCRPCSFIPGKLPRPVLSLSGITLFGVFIPHHFK